MSVTNVCKELNISRSWFYYTPSDRKGNEGEEIRKMMLIKNEYNQHPFYGYRKIMVALREHGLTLKITRQLMKKMGLQGIHPKAKTSISNKAHAKYAYLLKDKQILAPNHVWATDITYIRLNGAFVYLVAILDLYSRKVLSWKLSNTIDATFCVETIQEALERYGIPAVFNSDQGSQFTSDQFLDVLKSNDIQISMDGKGRALDNIYVERAWRSLKYEEIYLKCYSGMKELKEGIKEYYRFYNSERFHQSLDYSTPDERYYGAFAGLEAA
jgi:putative transposase